MLPVTPTGSIQTFFKYRIMSLRILLNGSKGRMGRAISSIASEHSCEIVASIDEGDDPVAAITMFTAIKL